MARLSSSISRLGGLVGQHGLQDGLGGQLDPAASVFFWRSVCISGFGVRMFFWLWRNGGPYVFLALAAPLVFLALALRMFFGFRIFFWPYILKASL